MYSFGGSDGNQEGAVEYELDGCLERIEFGNVGHAISAYRDIKRVQHMSRQNSMTVTMDLIEEAIRMVNKRYRRLRGIMIDFSFGNSLGEIFNFIVMIKQRSREGGKILSRR